MEHICSSLATISLLWSWFAGSEVDWDWYPHGSDPGPGEELRENLVCGWLEAELGELRIADFGLRIGESAGLRPAHQGSIEMLAADWMRFTELCCGPVR